MKPLKILFKKKLVGNEQGSALILTIFVILTLSLLCISYWKLIEIQTENVYLKEKKLQAYQLAKAGIEDALYEVREGNSWEEGVLASNGWTKATANTFLKSSILNSLDPNLFNYPATFTVTVTGDASIGTINIMSTGEATPTESEKSITTTLQAYAVKTYAGEIYILKLEEI